MTTPRLTLLVVMAVNSSILDHLQGQHVSAFDTFSKLCYDKGLLALPPGMTQNDVRDGLNDETTLLRYLRARKFDPHSALKQLQEAVNAHDANHISTLYNEIEVPAFETARFLYPHWCGRRTKEGLPICLFDMGHLNRYTLAEYENTRRAGASSPRLERGITAVQRASIAHDHLTRFVFPLCTAMKDRPNPTAPILSALYLVDLASFTMRQGWDIKNYTTDIGHLLMTGYPEIIDRLFVLNAPLYFAMMWGIMKQWMDPGTADKVVVLTARNQLSTLMEYIDLENIPTKFGGSFDWDHGKALDIDIGIMEGLEWEDEKGLRPGPMKWVLDEAGRKTAVAVGSFDKVPRADKIARMRVD